MSSNVCILDKGPACEPDKLIVEIIGKQHPDTQRLLICDAEGQPLDTVTSAAKEEEISSEGVSSLLKVWDWEEQPGETLYLEIASDSGSPIRLPLLPDLRATPRQEQAQLNQIVPVVPCTALSGTRQADDLGVPVLVRSGYIYVFVSGKLWRELEVRFTEQGTRYFDVNVAQYRNEHGFANVKRRATGVALEDIWLPSQWNGSWPGAVELMFSEVQLSASRLKHYERHENFLSPRVRNPRLLVTESLWQRLWANAPDGLAMLEAQRAAAVNQSIVPSVSRLRMESSAFPVALCAPQRQRQPGHEWLLDQPASMLCDLTGSYPEKALNCTREATQTWRTGVATDPPADFESEAWRSCYNGCDPQTAAVWQAQDAQSDALQAVRDRKLYAVLLPDPMNRMRHLHARIDSLQELLKYCTQLAMEHPHHASAIVLHNMAVPRHVGGSLNPLNQHFQDRLEEQGKREINIATAAVERANIWKLLDSAQLGLSKVLSLSQFQQCLGDHLSLDHLEYPAAMFFAVRVMACLAATPAQLDPLALKGDIHDAVTGVRLHSPGRNDGQQFLVDMTNRITHPLHGMLLPEIRVNALFDQYRKPAEQEPNNGDGRFRATALASLEDMDAPDEESETLDGMTLAALMASGTLQDSFTAHSSFKAGMAVLSKIHEILSSAITAAENHMSDAANQLDNRNQRVAASRADLDQARQDQSRHRVELGEQALLAKIRLHGLAAEHLRQTMPNAFEGAKFVRSGQFKGSEYYLFGLEDLPEADPNRASEKLFGQYLDGAGNRLATTDARAARGSGMPITPETGTYFAIPRSNPTREILSKLNQATLRETLADSDLLAARAFEEQAGMALQRAVEKLRRHREGGLNRALNSRPFSAAVLGLEIWNVQVASEEYGRSIAEGRGIRAFAGMAGANLDLLIAFEALVSKVAGNQTILSVTANKTVFTISDELATKFLGPRLAKSIISVVSVRILGQVAAGLVFSGLSLSDALHSALWADKAIWGHYMMAAGGLMGAAGVMLGGSTLFGPVGIIAVLLIIGGAAVVALFSNTDFEDWLSGSIFSVEGGFSKAIRAGMDMLPYLSASPRHLEDPDEALYRLVGLLAGISIQIENNPDYDPNAFNNGSKSIESLKKRANTRITVRSNVSGIAGQLSVASTSVHCLLVRKEIRIISTGFSPGRSETRHDLPERSTPVLLHDHADTRIVYVNTPEFRPQSHYYQEADLYHWEVRAQYRFIDSRNGKKWIFPALSPKLAPIDPSKETAPDLRKTNQPLWADQKTHAATGVAS
ncbi:MAG: hypothetical protein CVV07_08235 [Gammaproteobacteria bacterium HGW-Gammaproteobacteria-11]|nr:MAG: hypothetical protein CVV07_08235 [Gammaproteobacteria bacterium HGW-Gammaproteobacteria-11]